MAKRKPKLGRTLSDEQMLEAAKSIEALSSGEAYGIMRQCGRTLIARDDFKDYKEIVIDMMKAFDVLFDGVEGEYP